MDNYIVIDGVTYLLVKQEGAIKPPESGMADGIKLSDIKAGGAFKIGAHEFFVLEQSGDTTAAILKDLLVEETEFGKNNCYEGSKVDQACNQFAEEIAAIVGADNLVEHTVDLTSDDGLKDYGSVKRRTSLLTAERYRRYVEILDLHKVEKWWWMATPYSTKRHEDDSWAKCVSPSGFIGIDYFRYGGGVRPFCIFKSSIFVSC